MVLIPIILAALGAAIILAVMFAPERELDESLVSVRGEPLAIEATSCERTEPVKQVHAWDSVDQHWGETIWMAPEMARIGGHRG